MATAKVFMSGRSQAVRLPKEFRVSGNELAITRVGRSLVLTPIDAQWSDFFNMLQQFETDKPVERNQPQEHQQRDSLADE
jgi:antitoxin VapB